MFSLEELFGLTKSATNKIYLDDTIYPVAKKAGSQLGKLNLQVNLNDNLLEYGGAISLSEKVSKLLDEAGINAVATNIIQLDDSSYFNVYLSESEAYKLNNFSSVQSFELPTKSNNTVTDSKSADKILFKSSYDDSSSLTSDIVYGVKSESSSYVASKQEWEVYLPKYWIDDGEIIADSDEISGFALEDFSVSAVFADGKAVSGDDLPYGVKAVWNGKDVTDLVGATDANGNPIGDGIADYDSTGAAANGGKEFKDYYAFVIDSGILQAAADADFNYSGTNLTDSTTNLEKNFSKSFVNGEPDPFVDTSGHGTHVAGTIAAKANGVGVVGVAPGATVVSLKVFGNGGASFQTIIDAVNYAVGVIDDPVNGLDKTKCVINMSLGGGYNAALNTAIANGAAKGIQFAVAAGNSSADVDGVSPASSGDLANVYTVSAVDNKFKMSSWSNYDNWDSQGDDCDVAGPGVAVKSYYLPTFGNSYSIAKLSGTSMASPAVAGLLLAGDGQGVVKGPMVTANAKGFADPFALAYSEKDNVQESPDDGSDGGKNPPGDTTPPPKGEIPDFNFDGLYDSNGNILKDKVLYSAVGNYEGSNGTYALTNGQGSWEQGNLEAALGIEGGKLDGTIQQAKNESIKILFAPEVPTVDKVSIDATEGSGANTKGYAKVGDKITFSYVFSSNDYSPYNDYSFFSLGENTYTLAALGGLANGGGVPDNGSQNGTAEIILTADDLYKKENDKYVKGVDTDNGGFYNFSVGVVDAIDTCVDTALLVKGISVLGKDESVADTPEDTTQDGQDLSYTTVGDVGSTGTDEVDLVYQMSTGAKLNSNLNPVLQGIMEFKLGLTSNILDSDLNGSTTAIDATEGSAIQAVGFGKVGEKVSFDYLFSTNDYEPYNDFAWYSINGKVKKLAKIGEDTPSFGTSGGSKEYVLTADDFKNGESGDVVLNVGVMDVKDWCVTSNLTVSNIVIDDQGTIKTEPTPPDAGDAGNPAKFAYSAYGAKSTDTPSGIADNGSIIVSTASGALSQAAIEYGLGLNYGVLDSALSNTKPKTNATEGSYVKVTGTGSVNDQIKFTAEFTTKDYKPFNDYSFYSVNGNAYKIASVGKGFDGETDVADGSSNNPSSKSVDVTYTFKDSDFNGNTFGNFTIGMGVMDAFDGAVDSQVKISDFGYFPNAGEDTAKKEEDLIKFTKVGTNASGAQNVGFLLTTGGCAAATSQSELEQALSLKNNSLDGTIAGFKTDSTKADDATDAYVNALNGNQKWTKKAVNATEGSGLYAEGTANVGDTASFNYAFDTNDYTPYADYSFYGVSTKQSSENNYDNKQLFALGAIGDNVNNYNKDTDKTQDKFQTVTYTFTSDDFGGQTSGDYKFSWGVVDAKDKCVTSKLYVKEFYTYADDAEKASNSSGFNVASASYIDGITSAEKVENDVVIIEYGNTFFDKGGDKATMSTGDGSVSQIFLEDQLGFTAGTLDEVAGNATEGSACQAYVEAGVGDLVTFKYNMWTNDYIPYQDFSFIAVNGKAQKLAEVGVDLDAFDSKTGIVNYVLTKDDFEDGQDSGVINLSVGIVDVKDTAVNSFLEVWDFSVGGYAKEESLASLGFAQGSDLTQLVSETKDINGSVTSTGFVKLSIDGQTVGESYSDSWNVLAASQEFDQNNVGVGFDVLLKGQNQAAGQFMLLKADTDGNASLSNVQWKSESEAVDLGYEDFAGVDLDKDGIIENAKDSALGALEIYNSGVGALTLAFGGFSVQDSADYDIKIADEAAPDMMMFTGQKVTNVLVENKSSGSDAGKWAKWQADDKGNLATDPSSSWETKANAIAFGWEAQFKFDIDKNGLIDGGASYQVAGNEGEAYVLKDVKGEIYDSTNTPLWNPLAAIETNNGFEMVLKGASTTAYDGYYQIVETNGFGVFTDEYSNWITETDLLKGDYEKTYNFDLNGDNAFGFSQTVESDGDLTLIKDGQGLASIQSAAGIVDLKFNDQKAGDTTFAGWSVIATETVDATSKALWKNAASGLLSVWDLDANGNYVSYKIYSQSDYDYYSIESAFNVDCNSDEIIGSSGYNTIDAIDANSNHEVKLKADKTILVSDGVIPASTVKFNGENLKYDAFTGWELIGAEDLGDESGPDYTLAWQNNASKLVSIWKLNVDWNFIDYEIKSFADNDIFGLEDNFNYDLNNDGIIGQGTIALDVKGNNQLNKFYDQELYVKTVDVVGDAQIKYNGAALLADTFSGWQPFAVETVNGTNQLFWKNETSGLLSVWDLDGTWSYADYNIYDLNSKQSFDIETAISTDINNDGIVGGFYTLLESEGSTSLYKDQNANVYYGDQDSPSTEISFGGKILSADQFSGWDLKGAEVVNGTNQLIWLNQGSGQQSIWSLDSNWNYQSYQLVDSSSQAGMLNEKDFYQDLDSNAVLGASSATLDNFNVVENQGDIELVLKDGNQVHVNVSNTQTAVKFTGATLTSDQFAGWTLKGAEVVNGVNQLFWQNNAGLTSVWSFDSNWNYESYELISSSNTKQLSLLEQNFIQDFNVDSLIGTAKSEIESDGAVKLLEDASKQILVFADEKMQDVLINGSAVTSDKYAGWTLKGAEVTDQGNQIVWYNSTDNLLSVWSLDSNWNFVGYDLVNESDVTAFNNVESNFYQDINN